LFKFIKTYLILNFKLINIIINLILLKK
jgi:hypothetical protein